MASGVVGKAAFGADTVKVAVRRERSICTWTWS